MPSKFNLKSCFFALIVVDVAIVRNFVQAGPNSFDVVGTKEFNDKVLKSKNPIIAQFHAPWSIPCKALTRSLERAVDSHNGKLKLAKVDVSPEMSGDVARQQGIRSVPIITVYKGGKCVDKMIGLGSDVAIHEFVKKQAE